MHVKVFPLDNNSNPWITEHWVHKYKSEESFNQREGVLGIYKEAPEYKGTVRIQTTYNNTNTDKIPVRRLFRPKYKP